MVCPCRRTVSRTGFPSDEVMWLEISSAWTGTPLILMISSPGMSPASAAGRSEETISTVRVAVPPTIRKSAKKSTMDSRRFAPGPAKMTTTFRQALCRQ